MNETKRHIKMGTEPYHITKAEAGEASRAARKHKIQGDVGYWRRPKGKASK